MSWELLGYAAVCVVVPAAWGLIVYWASSRIEKRVLRRHDGTEHADGEDGALPLDYHI